MNFLKSFAVAGSIVIFILGLEMVLGIEFFKSDNNDATSTVVPIAFPLIAGSGTLTTIMSLKATFERDPNLYYEDGFQEMVNRGAHIATAAIGDIPWIEVDTLEDLERAREIVCHY